MIEQPFVGTRRRDRAAFRKFDQDEVAGRRDGAQAGVAQGDDFTLQKGAQPDGFATHHVEVGIVCQRRDSGGLAGGRHVERSAHAVERGDDRQRCHRPADALRGKAVDLGEGAGDDQVWQALRQRQTVFIVAFDEFGIGTVKHQHDVAGHARDQSADVGGRQQCACWVVGIGDVDDTGGRRDGGQYGIDIAGIIHIRHHHRRRADAAGGAFVNGEPVAHADDLVTRAGEGGCDHVQYFIAAGAADDVGRVHAIFVAQRLTQARGGWIGIAMALRNHILHCRDGHGRWPPRILVRGQFGHHGRAGA